MQQKKYRKAKYVQRRVCFVNVQLVPENWIEVSVLVELRTVRIMTQGTSNPKVLSYTRCLKVWPGEPGVPKLLSHVKLFAPLRITPHRNIQVKPSGYTLATP